jgi:AraC-like DNA-binding protein
LWSRLGWRRLAGMKHDPGLGSADEPRPDPFAPGVIRLRQAVRAAFRAVTGEAAVILRVDRGRKVIRGAMTAEVPEGALVLMPAGVALDVENHPGADGVYRATAILVPHTVAAPRGAATAGQSGDPRGLAAFERALAALRAPAVPGVIKDHAVLEVLLWLDAAGVRLPPEAPPALPERVRLITGAALGRDWRAPEIATALAMSEATLRRRLAAAGTGLAEMLVDQRMNRALGLLQATDLPVGVIAGEVGYASPSRFAARFRARFGISPGAIRGKDDRQGREVARHGTVTAKVGG